VVVTSSSNKWPRNSLRRSTTNVQHVVGGASDRRRSSLLAAWAALGAHGHAAYAELATWAARGALSQRGARGIVNGEYFGVLLLPLAPSLASSRFPAGMELSTGMLLLLLGPRAAACRGWRSAVNVTQQMENEKRRRKRKMTSGTRTLVIEERCCNEVYIFIYAFSWVQIIFIHI